MLPVNWEGSEEGVLSYMVNKYKCTGLALSVAHSTQDTGFPFLVLRI